ncbi:hypothetical protein HA402_004464 [Bradysia odoriphaga]|nr:hypothetical protein HA402_004464 [Bradysia odoriphaga]
MKSDQIIVNLFLCFIFGATIFIYGFFPISFKNGKTASAADLPDVVLDVPLNTSGYRSRHSHSVLMVIDAMRLDFAMQNDSMKYFSKLMKNDDACLFHLKVQPPTVTLPRIKAMISGTVPNFIDVVLNLGNSELKTDSFVHQLLQKKQRISFCGDNTWVKMFPNKFHRQLENMDSLFVNDFYEGDKNITHRLESELKSADWELLILHYLGLDHIGHVEGPKSPKIHTKLQEMDNVIMRIHLEILDWKKRLKLPSLFLITGDHGMRDTGGHGGSTFGETNIPLMVVGAGCRQTEEIYEQIDIAPTVSVLLGLPIPDSSIGSLITDMLVDLSYEDQLYALNYNSERLLKMITEKITESELWNNEFFTQLTEARVLHAKFLRKTENLEIAYKRCKLLYSSSSRAMSDLLSTFYVKYDQISVALGVALMTATCIVLIRFVMSDNFSDTITIGLKIPTVVSICVLSAALKHFICEFSDCSLCLNLPVSYIFSLATVVVIFFLLTISKLKSNWTNIQSTFSGSKLIRFLLFATLVHTFSLASSSFVEEEHQTWYFITHTFLLIICMMSLKKRQNEQWLLNAELLKTENRQKRIGVWSLFERFFFEFNWFMLFGLLLVGRRLNQTGDKWLSLPDIGDFLITEEHRLWNSCFVVISLCAMIYKLTDFNGTLTNVLTFTAAVLIYYYRTLNGHVYFAGIKPSESHSSITIFWLNILEIVCINCVPIFYKYLKRTHSRADLQNALGVNVTIFCLVSALLHKPHNIYLNFVILLTCDMLNTSCNQLFGGRNNLLVKVVGHYWIGKMFFFYQVRYKRDIECTETLKIKFG